MDKVYVVLTEYSDCGEYNGKDILGIYENKEMAREFLRQDLEKMMADSFIAGYEDLEIHKYSDNYELNAESSKSYIKTRIKEFELK